MISQDIDFISRPGFEIIEDGLIAGVLDEARPQGDDFARAQLQWLADNVPLLHREEGRLFAATWQANGNGREAIPARTGFSVGVKVLERLVDRSSADLITIRDNVESHTRRPYRQFVTSNTLITKEAFSDRYIRGLAAITHDVVRANCVLSLAMTLTFAS